MAACPAPPPLSGQRSPCARAEAGLGLAAPSGPGAGSGVHSHGRRVAAASPIQWAAVGLAPACVSQ